MKIDDLQSLTVKCATFYVQKVGQRPPMTPRVPPPEILLERIRMVVEETAEAVIACHEGDLVKIADSVGDAMFVLRGLAIACGFDPHYIEHIVSDCNLTKGALDRNKKGGKTASYVHPEPLIREELMRQGWDGVDPQHPSGAPTGEGSVDVGVLS